MPSEKFDGWNKNCTKQHWQVFKDFCDQQKLYFEPLIVDGADPIAAAPFEEITKYFKMTLTEMARTWFDRNTFADVKDLEKKFLTDFSPYGKTHPEWVSQWHQLCFCPDTDNFDEFLDKFEDLAALIRADEGFKMAAFKVVMPREVQIAIHDKTTYEECTQTARDLLIILQNPIANKMSTLSLLQSRSPSPKPQS